MSSPGGGTGTDRTSRSRVDRDASAADSRVIRAPGSAIEQHIDPLVGGRIDRHGAVAHGAGHMRK